MTSYLTQYLDNILDLITDNQIVLLTVPAGSDGNIMIPFAVSNSADDNGNNVKSFVVVGSDDIAISLFNEQQKYSGFGGYITINDQNRDDTNITYVSHDYMIKLLLTDQTISFCDVIILSELYPGTIKYYTIISLWLKAFELYATIPRLVVINSKPYTDNLLPNTAKLEIKNPIVPKFEYYGVPKEDLYNEIIKLAYNYSKSKEIFNMIIIITNKDEFVSYLENNKFDNNIIFITDIFRYNDVNHKNKKIILITTPNEVAYNYLPNTKYVIDSMLEIINKQIPSGGKRTIVKTISQKTAIQHEELINNPDKSLVVRMCAYNSFSKLFKDDLYNLENELMNDSTIIINMLKNNISPESIFKNINKNVIQKNINLIKKLALVNIPKLSNFINLLNLSVRNSAFLWYWIRGKRFGNEIITEGKKYNINFEEVEIDETSEYSSIKPYHLTSTSEIFVLEGIKDIESIIDATANIGGDSINFMRLFPKAKIVSLEIDTKISYILQRNMNNLSNILKNTAFPDQEKLSYDTRVINISAVKYFEESRYADVIYFDPPWGGPDYLLSEKLELFLDNISIGSIINNIIRKGTTPLVILKLPMNANIDIIKSEIHDANFQIHDIYNSVKKTPDYKLMFIREKLYNRKSAILAKEPKEVELIKTTNSIFEGIVVASIIDSFSGSYFKFPTKSRTYTIGQNNKILADHKRTYFDKYLGYNDLDTYLNMWNDYIDHTDDLEYWCDQNSINITKMTDLILTVNEVANVLGSFFDIEIVDFDTNEVVNISRPILATVYSDLIYIDPYSTGYFNPIAPKEKYTLENIENVNEMSTNHPLGVIALSTKTFQGPKNTIRIIDFGVDTNKTGLGESIVKKGDKFVKEIKLPNIPKETKIDIELLNKNPFDILDDLIKSRKILSVTYPIILNDVTIDSENDTLLNIAKKITRNKSNDLRKILNDFQDVNVNSKWALKVVRNSGRFDDILKFIPLFDNIIYLDIGSGDAVDFEFLTDKFKAKRAVSIDISDSRINKSAEFHLLKINKPLPFPDESIDIISILHALHHSSDALFRLKDVHRMLKTGGIFILKDHDVTSTTVANIVSFEHLVYSIGEGKADINSAKNYNEIEPMYYYSANYIKEYLISIGFQVLMFQIYENPTKTWKGVFIKI